MREITKLVIHCADTPDGSIFHASDIDRWHRERGFSAIGYHFVIPISGVLEAGRPVAVKGAHAKGHNWDSIGICLIGRSRFTPAQWATLQTLVVAHMHTYPDVDVLGHRDLPDVRKTCPGFSVREWVADGFQPPAAHIYGAL